MIKLRWGKDAHDMIFEGAMPGIKFALGENPKRAGNPTGQRIGAGNVQGRYPATRMGVEDVIREAFNEAKAYQQSWNDYDAEGRAVASKPSRRAAISSWSRWWKCWRANG